MPPGGGRLAERAAHQHSLHKRASERGEEGRSPGGPRTCLCHGTERDGSEIRGTHRPLSDLSESHDARQGFVSKRSIHRGPLLELFGGKTAGD